jgi:hypothetical protein
MFDECKGHGFRGDAEMNERPLSGSDRSKNFTRNRVLVLSASLPVIGLAAAAFLAVGAGSSDVPEETAGVGASTEMAAAIPAPSETIAQANVAKADRPATAQPGDGGKVVGGVEPLTADDPRWGGQTDGEARPRDRQLASQLGSGAGDAAARRPGGAFAAALSQLPPSDRASVRADPLDRATTSAIGEQSPGVDVAETDAEVAALEAAAAAEQSDMPDAAFAGEGQRMMAARIREYVNLRDGPSNESNVITIVPAGTSVEAQPIEECVHFCAVTVDGERGYIGKTFIAYEDAPTADAAVSR